MNLSLLIAIPVLTALVILFFRKKEQVRLIAAAGSVAQLIIGLWLAYNVGSANGGPLFFEQNHTWYSALNISYHIGVDGISVAMIVLTAFVVLAGVLVSWKLEDFRIPAFNWQAGAREFFVLLMLLSAGAYGFFISLDLFTLFFFLEIAVIPKFLLIGIWGSGQKENSALKLVLMLMAGSALVFVGILGIYAATGTYDMVRIAAMDIPYSMQQLFFPFAFLGFGVFTALFPFHTWVPDGHSSAPTAGSMFLAGISMKLGGYGCLRVCTFLMPAAAEFYAPWIILLACIAILYGAFATLMQTDLKYMNAYSSVSHCGFVLLGIGMMTTTAITGAVMQMVSHGLMTALFFACIGMIYERTHTRQLAEMGGLLKVMPFISTVFVIAGLCSLGLPGLSGFVSEMTVFVGSWQRPETAYRIATIIACASIVVTAVYILRAVGKVLMGTLPQGHGFETLRDAQWNEKMAAILLTAAILAIGVAPFLLTELIQPDAELIMQKVIGEKLN